ncbi:MAG: TOBE domain-containing protein, partial [Pseudomonadota bacterium]
QRTALARAIAKDAKAIFLDEPLANLDYKLREELRDQLPDILGQRGTVVVYATSEPSEALLLGGRTALVHEGTIAQTGPTSEIYRRPADLTSARVFSDPPINFATVEKASGQITLGDATWPASGAASELADGPYTLGLRPHHVLPTQTTANTVPVSGRVAITELSGSESVAHFELGDQTWVSQSPGVHPYEVGEMHDFHLLPDRCLYFEPNGGALVAGG